MNATSSPAVSAPVDTCSPPYPITTTSSIISTKDISGAIQAETTPSLDTEIQQVSDAFVPVLILSILRIRGFNQPNSDSTWLIFAVNDAVSSCMPSDILYIFLPSGTRISAAIGMTINIVSVIFNLDKGAPQWNPQWR